MRARWPRLPREDGGAEQRSRGNRSRVAPRGWEDAGRAQITWGFRQLALIEFPRWIEVCIGRPSGILALFNGAFNGHSDRLADRSIGHPTGRPRCGPAGSKHSTQGIRKRPRDTVRPPSFRQTCEFTQLSRGSCSFEYNADVPHRSYLSQRIGFRHISRGDIPVKRYLLKKQRGSAEFPVASLEREEYVLRRAKELRIMYSPGDVTRGARYAVPTTTATSQTRVCSARDKGHGFTVDNYPVFGRYPVCARYQGVRMR